MPTKILYNENDSTPPQICFADFAGDFGPTAANDLRNATDTEVQLTLASLADGSYRQSAKFDFGEHWAMEYYAQLAIELAATPTAGNIISAYLSYSNSSTAGTGNEGGASGSDAAYTGYSSNADDSIKQVEEPISIFTVTAQATTTVQIIGGFTFSPRARYASLILHNEAGAAVHSDDVECHLVLNPVVKELQN